MQLTPRRMGRVSQALGLLTANLLAATVAHAQDAHVPVATAQTEASADSSVNDDTQSDLGFTRVDTAVLFYQESGGRVRATEPVVNVTLNGSGGDILSVKLTADALTGATPNGAAPWNASQTFLTPAQAPGVTTAVTTASGGSTLVTIPGTGTVARQYVVAPHALPIDTAFRDHRYAVDLGYSLLWNPDTRFNFGAGLSTERDYSSYTLTGGVARDLNSKRTTVSLGVDFEFDRSRPVFGTPTPFTVMSAEPKGANRSKTVASLVVGATQVVNRYWLAQVNYSVGTTNGYQTDPYRIISVADPTTGAPLQYLYESRPGSRLRQSLYFGNKIAIGPTFADISVRGYHDSWGISSVTVAASERIPITSWLYVEPEARYYSQTAASFFHNYLLGGQALPAFASSDSRLDRFSAVTAGLKVGLKLSHTGELYLQVDDYKQTGRSHPSGAPGALANENLFAGVSAANVIVGYTFAFW